VTLGTTVLAAFLGLQCLCPQACAELAQAESGWHGANGFRVLLTVDARGRPRSNSPASVEFDFQQALREQGARGNFDEHSVEVVSTSGAVRRVPHLVESLFGASKVTLHFLLPDQTCTNLAVYFDTVESGRGQPRRYHGLIGDGDRFVEKFERREIAASHFDQFVDFDGDGDLDLFKGGVEPFVYCFENVGGNRLVERGRLASGGQIFKLPCSRANRSWVTVAFFDIDGDGDQDFFPSFGDGPDAGKFIFYRNVTRESHGQLAFERVGPLQTTAGVPLAGGAQAGGWFPSITFVRDWDGDGLGPDALVGSNHRCWLYRSLSRAAEPDVHRKVNRERDVSFPLGEQRSPTFANAVALQAGGKDIELINPRFDAADIDRDGDLDLFAATQPGPVHFFRNIGSPASPQLAAGIVVAWDGKYLIGDAHSGVTAADFDGDSLPDLVSGRFWERADQGHPAAPRDFGGFWKNTGARGSPRFARRARRAPFAEQFQACDAVRQNCVRAADWDDDGRPDLLAGDTDGFIWFFRNASGSSGREEALSKEFEMRVSLLASAATGPMSSVFAPGERLQAAGSPLSVAGSGGHARFDVCDWNNDGRNDLVVADGSGAVTLFLNRGRKSKPALAAGQRLNAAGAPLQLGARASALVCDWDNDGRKDLVLADDKGYYFARNTGRDDATVLATPKPILFGGRRVSYVRPNLGSFVDWDNDGKRDLIGCHFENSIRFYRNLGSGAPSEEPSFSDPEGVVILHGESPQMISGADVLDWTGDGDLDLLTGQGHGGSGLRFYERDWIEDELHGTHPVAKVLGVETKATWRQLKPR
jgi:hypothetical protein